MPLDRGDEPPNISASISKAPQTMAPDDIRKDHKHIASGADPSDPPKPPGVPPEVPEPDKPTPIEEPPRPIPVPPNDPPPPIVAASRRGWYQSTARMAAGVPRRLA